MITCRCLPTQICVPDFAASVAKQLPIQGTSFRLYGVCHTPCDCDNTVSYECGIDGNTYLNSCQRACANVLVSVLCCINFMSDCFFLLNRNSMMVNAIIMH